MVLKKLDTKARGPFGEPINPEADSLELKPFEAAMLMNAFCKAQMFSEVELLESLESVFLQRVEEASPADLVVLFSAHSAWCSNVVEETLQSKNQKRRVFKVFK